MKLVAAWDRIRILGVPTADGACATIKLVTALGSE
jgi:hypothetical protein